MAGKRRRYFVDREQIRFAVTVALYCLLFPFLFLAALVVLPTVSFLLLGRGVRQSEFYESLLNQVLVFAYDHWWLVVLALVVVGVMSLKFSHRIFGPLRGFETALLQKMHSPREPVSCEVRKGDYFRDLAKLLERALNTPAKDAASTAEKDSDAG